MKGFRWDLYIFFTLIFSLSSYNYILSAQNNVIYYTTNNDRKIIPSNTGAFDASIVDNIYNDTLGCITFDKDIHLIGDSAFQNCKTLTSVILPDSISSIGKYAFHNCIRLDSLALPDSIFSIGDGAFLNCKKLVLDIDSLQKTQHIGEYAFASCAKIAGNTASLDSTCMVDRYAFVDCPNVNQGDSIVTDTTKTVFRFLTWNIEGFAWGFNHRPEQADSVVESRGVKQLIEMHSPRIYTLNEVPLTLSHKNLARGSCVKSVCGDNDDKVHSVVCCNAVANAIVTQDVIIDREDLYHTRQYLNHYRRSAVITQYIDGVKVAFVCVHFEPTPKKATEEQQKEINEIRVSQAKDVADAIANYEHVIVAGDFNCNYPIYGEDLGGVATQLNNVGLNDIRYKRKWYVDHIFIKGFEALDWEMDNLDLKLSDHPLLWADLQLK